MQKKLLAVAVAGALFVPAGAAMAQSSVTISGFFKVGIDQYKLSQTNRGGKKSDTRLTDNSSRMIFGITEDLGGGLAAIAQLDARFAPDDASSGFAETGNTWVGLRSSSLGTLTFGRHDLHYGKQPDRIASKAGALMSAAISLMDYTYNGNAIANATRTANVVRYDTPKFGGFAMTAAYSTNPIGTAANEADLASNVRRGNGWTINPSYSAGPINVGASYWKAKADASELEQKSWVLYGSYTMGAFTIGAAVNDAETDNAAGVEVNDRRNWTIPVSFNSGPHTIYAHYTRAGKDKAADNSGVDEDDTKAKMYAIAYNYDLSKRTAVGVTFAKIKNDDAAAYNFFTNTGGLGSTGSAVLAGEDPRLIAFTVRHAF